MRSVDLRKMMHHIESICQCIDLENNKRKGAIGKKGIGCGFI